MTRSTFKALRANRQTGLPCRRTRCALILVSLSIGFFNHNILALPDDSQQRLTLEARSAEFDEANGITTYIGDVVMAQGSMKIEADKLVIYGELDSAKRVLATGNPARFQQQPSVTAQTVKAVANRLDYKVSDETLVLTGNASLEQEGNSLKSGRIEYDVKKSLVKAGSDKKQGTSEDRVRMVIPPKNLTPQSRLSPSDSDIENENSNITEAE